MINWVMPRIAATVSTIALAVFTGVTPQTLSASTGAVYTMTNAAGPNEIVAYNRTANGDLGTPRMFPTGGMGTGAGLGSQGAIALSPDGHWLLAVNAGSNDVTVFSVQEDGSLTARSKTPSGGTMPISVAIHGDTVFVLNAGGNPTINGFRLTQAGDLAAIPGLVGVLTGAGPAQVSFDDHGTSLIVTDKGTNTIEIFALDDGSLMGPVVTASAGPTPFGFSFGHRDVLIVSEAAGGAPGASTVSSYRLGDDGNLQLITPSLATTQGAACWVAVTNNGKFAYTTNTADGSISSVAVGTDGSLTLLEAVAGSTGIGTAPIDLAFSVNSQYLYALASGTISAFRVSSDGSLTPIGTVAGLPLYGVGLAAH
jgi:6-phosphogluconolactonase